LPRGFWPAFVVTNLSFPVFPESRWCGLGARYPFCCFPVLSFCSQADGARATSWFWSCCDLCAWFFRSAPFRTPLRLFPSPRSGLVVKHAPPSETPGAFFQTREAPVSFFCHLFVPVRRVVLPCHRGALFFSPPFVTTFEGDTFVVFFPPSWSFAQLGNLGEGPSWHGEQPPSFPNVPTYEIPPSDFRSDVAVAASGTLFLFPVRRFPGL